MKKISDHDFGQAMKLIRVAERELNSAVEMTEDIDGEDSVKRIITAVRKCRGKALTAEARFVRALYMLGVSESEFPKAS